MPPWVFYPEYEFELDTGTAERLGLNAAEDAVVFAVVTLARAAGGFDASTCSDRSS